MRIVPRPIAPEQLSDLPPWMEPVSIVREVIAKRSPVPLEPRTDTPVNCEARGSWKYAAAARALERELFVRRRLSFPEPSSFSMFGISRQAAYLHSRHEPAAADISCGTHVGADVSHEHSRCWFDAHDIVGSQENVFVFISCCRVQADEDQCSF